jgi:hypothetical protein
MGFHGLNLWAVLGAAVSAFVLGVGMRHFLFGRAWKGANGFGSEEPPAAGAKVFVISFVLSLVNGPPGFQTDPLRNACAVQNHLGDMHLEIS